MDTQEEIYQNLKKYLPKGEMKKIAKEHNMSLGFVSDVARGKRKNAEILNALFLRAQKYKKLEKSIINL